MNTQSAGSDESIERGFRAWVKKHKIENPDGLDRPFNYRGAYLSGVDPDKHGNLPDAFRIERMELGFDASMLPAGLYREQGSVPGQGPTDPAYDNPTNTSAAPMELGFDPVTGIWRVIGSVPGETEKQRKKREGAK